MITKLKKYKSLYVVSCFFVLPLILIFFLYKLTNKHSNKEKNSEVKDGKCQVENRKDQEQARTQHAELPGGCIQRAQLCLALCDPTDCNPQGSSVHEIFHARILKWVAISSPKRSSQPRDQTCNSRVSCCRQADSLPLSHQGIPY